MGSDGKQPPKARHKFGFEGSKKLPRAVATPRSRPVTNDDILNSLVKQSTPREDSEVFPEVGYAAPLQSGTEISVTTTRGRGHAVGAVILFLGGFIAVWLYGYVTRAYEIPYLSGLAQNPEIQVLTHLASSNPVLFGAISGLILLAVAGTLNLRHRKKS